VAYICRRTTVHMQLWMQGVWLAMDPVQCAPVQSDSAIDFAERDASNEERESESGFPVR
jgi:hypothetical protein